MARRCFWKLIGMGVWEPGCNRPADVVPIFVQRKSWYRHCPGCGKIIEDLPESISDPVKTLALGERVEREGLQTDQREKQRSMDELLKDAATLLGEAKVIPWDGFPCFDDRRAWEIERDKWLAKYQALMGGDEKP